VLTVICPFPPLKNIGLIVAQYTSHVIGILYTNFRAKKGRIRVINGIHHAIKGARTILETATYIRTKGKKFKDAN
jgi:hypothetical protein